MVFERGAGCNDRLGGLAAGVGTGSAGITASWGTVQGSAVLTVSPPVLVSIAISPGTASIAAGTTQQFAAIGTFTDGSMQDLSSVVTWASTQPSVAGVSGSGLANGAGAGNTTITATAGATTASATLTVGPPVLISISVTPANPLFALGTTAALTATGTYSDGSTMDLTKAVSWNTADSTIAIVNATGLASSVAVGNTTVAAASGSVNGSTTLSITPAVLVSIAVTPAIPTLPLGSTQQFTATGTYTDGSTQNITGTAQWSSDTPAVATIGSSGATTGLATTVAQGTATITATSGSVRPDRLR